MLLSSFVRANDVYEKLKSDHASEIAVIKANSKKMAVQISSLERQLQQKVSLLKCINSLLLNHYTNICLIL